MISDYKVPLRWRGDARLIFSGKIVEQKVQNGVVIGLGDGFGLSVMNDGIDDGDSSIACACENTDSS